jgi:hypothetical protein
MPLAVWPVGGRHRARPRRSEGDQLSLSQRRGFWDGCAAEIAGYKPRADAMSAARGVNSHGKLASSRPKWPYTAVAV